MTVTTPVISVLIPCYNHEDYIEEAVKSIWTQQRDDIEIIAIDDGSSDGTYRKLQELAERSPVPMHIETQENIGIVKTLNKALSKATGTYIALLASDDLYFDNVFTDLLEIMQKETRVKVLYANAKTLIDGVLSPTPVHGSYTETLLAKTAQEVESIIKTSVPSPLLTQCTLFDREMLIEIKGWDTDLKIDDWPLNIKIFEYLAAHNYDHSFVNIDMTMYRQHGLNISKNPLKMHDMIVEVINKYTPQDKKETFLREVSYNFGKMMLEYGHYKKGIQTLMSHSTERGVLSMISRAFNTLRLVIKYALKRMVP